MGKKLNLLVIGSGGREFAIAKKLKQSPLVERVYCAPGNVGMPTVGVEPVAIEEDDFPALIKFAKEHAIDWTFVGPEDALVAGITDRFQAERLKIFGPDARAAQLEGSKDYALDFMEANHVPTAQFATYDDEEAALEDCGQFGYPVVIKENGLAGGKGVVIAPDEEAARETISEMFANGDAPLVLEECLQGPEYSMFVAISDDRYRILPMAQDHKRAYDQDKGPNTGGMGSYSPLPQLSADQRQQMIDQVVEPTIRGLVKGGYHYCGILYIGLMLTADGPKVIEYNVRLGDPETQVVLPRMKTDLAALVDAFVNHDPLPEMEENDQAVLGVVLASKGYPKNPVHGQTLGQLPEVPGVEIDYANVAGSLDQLKGDGGRLLMVLAQADSLKEAQQRVYDYLDRLDEPECFYRHDIGAKAFL